MANVQESKKVDPTIILPKQMRDQLAQSEAIRNEFAKSPEPIEDATVIPTPGEEQPKVTPPSAVDTQAPTPAPVPTEDAQSFEQRYNSLRGRHEALQRNYDAMSSRVANLENLIATLQAQAPAPEQDPARLKQVHERLVTEEEEEDYGKDMLTVVGKKAREELNPVVAELREEIKQLRGQVQGVGSVIEKTAQEKMYETLDATVPTWQEINTSENFMTWLQALDDFSGQQRLGLLRNAFARQDTNRVLKFFQGFLAEASGLPQTPPSPGNSAPQTSGSENRPSLEDFAAPGRARSAPQPVLTADKPNYTTAYITKFYAEVRTGKWKGREAEAAAIEADIFAAGNEGRIIQSPR